MQKNAALRFIRIAVTAALLTYVLHQAGLLSIEGWQNLIDRFTQIKPLFIWALVGLGVLLTFSSALKWYMLARSRGLPVSLWRLYAYYLIGMFFNLILLQSTLADCRDKSSSCQCGVDLLVDC